MSTAHDHAAATIDHLGKSIDDMHHQLASQAGADKERLQKAVEKFKAAHAQFRNDALGCMN
jgi:hypothetical protein